MIGRLRDESGKFRARTYAVTVWNVTNGDIEYSKRAVTLTELDRIKGYYDEPIYSVQVEEND